MSADGCGPTRSTASAAIAASSSSTRRTRPSVAWWTSMTSTSGRSAPASWSPRDAAARSWPTRVDSPGCCPPRCAVPSGLSVSARPSSAGPCPACSPVRRLLATPDRSLAEALDRAGIRGELRTAGARPLPGGGARRLGGHHLGHVRPAADALLPPGLSGRAVDGDLAAPRAAGREPAGRHDPARPAGQRGRREHHVRTADEEIRADAVVVATSPRAAAGLTGIAVPSTKPLTTFWHTAPEPPSAAKLLHLDGAAPRPVGQLGGGDQRRLAGTRRPVAC